MDEDKKRFLNSRDKKRLKLLVTPSWASMLFAICCAFAVLIGVVFASNYQGTSYQQQVSEIRAKQINPHYSSEDTEFEGLEGNTFVDIVPVLVMWGIIGVVVYFFAVAIVRIVQQTASLKSELEYTNVNRKEMIRSALFHLSIRVVSGVLWVIFIFIFMKIILQYAINSAMAASAVGLSFESLLYSLICLFTIGFSVHIHTIFFRLLVFKPRVFSGASYIS